MATVIGLRKAVQEIKLDDSPDSPVYKLDLTDKSVIRKGKAVYSEFQKNKDALARVEEGSEAQEDIDAMAHVWRSVIESTLGKKAYQEIFDYVTDGQDIEINDALLLITPVVMYLLQELEAVVTANNNSAVLKYARSKSAASGAI